MKLGFIGLGRMGYNMCQKLLEKKHKIVVYDVDSIPGKKLARKGAVAVSDVKRLVEALPKPRIVWLMIPANYVDKSIKEVEKYLDRGDILIDGGNSFFKDSQRRYKALKKKGIKFIDVGTSGGVSGARHGACMMIGGDKPAFVKTEKLYRDMCVKDGYGYMGKTGAGHFVKGIHNGIEYGMLGAINEGFEAIKNQKNMFGTDLETVAKVYANGSIIESRLMTWLWDSFKTKGFLNSVSCEVPKGETEEEMAKLEKLSEMPVLKAARMSRVNSRKGKGCQCFTAAVRNQFGGHKVKKKK